MKLSRILISLLITVCAGPALAVDGYDSYNNTRVTIVAGDKVAVGEDLGLFIWKDQHFVAVEIENIVKRGNDLELEVTDKKHNKYFFFEISADDPGIDQLPHFDPGLPFPEVLPPEAHMKNDLLSARGNMLERGNQIEQGDMIRGESHLPQGNLIEQNSMPVDEHIMDRGLEPVQ